MRFRRILFRLAQVASCRFNVLLILFSSFFFDLELFNFDWSWFYVPLFIFCDNKLHNTQHRKFSSTRHRARYEWIERIVKTRKKRLLQFGKRRSTLNHSRFVLSHLTLTFRIRWHSTFESTKLESVTYTNRRLIGFSKLLMLYMETVQTIHTILLFLMKDFLDFILKKMWFYFI